VEPDLAALAAVRAWRRLCLRRGWSDAAPTTVRRLKRNKSGVYRMAGIGRDESAVIAKRCHRSTALVERTIYEQVLPRTAVVTPRYYGFVEAADRDHCWLFLEDAGDVKPTESHRDGIGTWVAGLHVATARLSVEVELPERGPAHFLNRLRAARDELGGGWVDAVPCEADRRVFETLVAVLERLDSRWSRVVHACEGAPRVLVHADLIRKNVRVRATADGMQVLALDWETAGWGPPAADLADLPHRYLSRAKFAAAGTAVPDMPWASAVPLDVYAAAVAPHWPGVGLREVERLSRAGAVFRLIAAIGWAIVEVHAGGFPKGMNRLRMYAADLTPAICALDS
jgi:hypothetical protein